MTNRAIPTQNLLRALKAALAPAEDFDLETLGTDRFLIRFKWDMDRRRVMNLGPWHFDKHLMVFAIVKEGTDPRTIELNWLAMNVQLFDLPGIQRTMEIATLLGQQLGNFLTADISSTSLTRPFWRLRVEIDTRKPLRRSLVIRLPEGRFTVSLKYEGLLNLCYFCGLLDHTVARCKTAMDTERVGGMVTESTPPPESSPAHQLWKRGHSQEFFQHNLINMRINPTTKMESLSSTGTTESGLEDTGLIAAFAIGPTSP
ncbi:hypothetical protein M569_09200 [Genlisea aurea]|uniref:Zinc knuckle CX2CX4HX4C domain-containing protein n=1 Tax=Genlisea aurea TaxID=192259 RepID=S8DZV0_9LAMI|nr:hypothetical protein M569_09200 [Genlisea aurea]